MKNVRSFFCTTVMLSAMLFVTPAASAETIDERIKRLEQMVEQLQQTLLETKSEMAKAKAQPTKGVVKTNGKEDITISTTGGGLKMKSSNGNKFQFSGRLMYDYASFDDVFAAGMSGEKQYESQNESEWRRTRLTAKGTVAKDWHYKFTLNIDDGDETADLNTGSIKYTGFKPLAVTVGKFKEPFGLERLTSSKWISTLERSFITDMVGDGANGQPDTGGIMLSGYHKEFNHFRWQVGAFDDADEDADGDDNYAMTGRLSMTPTWDKNQFLHLGVAYSIRDKEKARFRTRSRLGIHVNDRLTLGTVHKAEDVDQFGLEAAYVRGPLSLQAEYLDLQVDGEDLTDADTGAVTGSNDLDAEAWYLQASYVLTGETRGYKHSSGVFDKVKPAGKFGAWELVARYEDADVDDDIGEDGEMDKWILGVNWYANKNVKIAANYIRVDLDKDNNSTIGADKYTEDDGDAFAIRAQYVW